MPNPCPHICVDQWGIEHFCRFLEKHRGLHKATGTLNGATFDLEWIAAKNSLKTII